MIESKTPLHRRGWELVTILFMTASLAIFAFKANAQIQPFVGSYSGTADLVLADGSTHQRDLSVEITPSEKGFTVQWTTVTYLADGDFTEKSYKINFVPSKRDGLFAAAMKKDLFGHDVQLDPMNGEPFIWAEIGGETLTVYALFVHPGGGYEIQQYDRTLADGGLALEFSSVRNGKSQRTVSSFLKLEEP